MLAPIFGFAIPVICYFLDPVDRRRDYTLGYFCWCRETVTSSLIIITLEPRGTARNELSKAWRAKRGKLTRSSWSTMAQLRDTEQVVSSFTARYVPEPRRGYGHARNRGLAEARGAVIYFLDDDCVPEPDWSDVLWNVLDSGDADLASGSRAPGQPGLAARLEYLSTDGPVLSPGLAAGPARHLSTSNLILRREVVAKVGCFDTTLTMCEDRDFTTRARKLGFRLRYEPQGSRHALSRDSPAFRLPGQRCGTTEPELRNTSAAGAMRNRWRVCFRPVPALRLLLLPALAAAGTGISGGAQSAAKSRRAAAQPVAVGRAGLVALGRI